MQGAATVHHHPIHPALIPFPIAFLIGSGGADILFEATKDPFWSRAARTLMDAGIAGALGSAVFGLADYLTIRLSPSAKRTATIHLLTNLGLVGLYVANRSLRATAPDQRHTAGYALSAAGLAALLYSGWLGGGLSFEYHLGMEEPAHDAGNQPRHPSQDEIAA